MEEDTILTLPGKHEKETDLLAGCLVTAAAWMFSELTLLVFGETVTIFQ